MYDINVVSLFLLYRFSQLAARMEQYINGTRDLVDQAYTKIVRPNYDVELVFLKEYHIYSCLNPVTWIINDILLNLLHCLLVGTDYTINDVRSLHNIVL